MNCQTMWTDPVRNYLNFRSQIRRGAELADEGDWEEALAALDEARLAVQYLERFQRLNAKQKAA